MQKRLQTYGSFFPFLTLDPTSQKGGRVQKTIRIPGIFREGENGRSHREGSSENFNFPEGGQATSGLVHSLVQNLPDQPCQGVGGEGLPK